MDPTIDMVFLYIKTNIDPSYPQIYEARRGIKSFEVQTFHEALQLKKRIAPQDI